MRAALLRIEGRKFVAGAVWETDGIKPSSRRRDSRRRAADTWTCVQAAPIIAWMKGASPYRVRSWLKKMDYDYEWIPIV